MDIPKERDFRARKYWTKNKFKGSRRKVKRRMTAEDRVPQPTGPARPNDGIGNLEEIDAALTFVSASKKKLGFFENEQRTCGDGSASAVICDIGTLTMLSCGATCPMCQQGKLSVRKSAEKLRGLATFLKLLCKNSDCPASILSSTDTSRRVASGGDASASQAYDSGSSRDSFASKVKAVVAARAVDAGHKLSRFSAILGLPTPMHHKTFNAIGKRVHAAATAAASQNLEKARS